jgi:hypothetical protein
MHEHAQVVGKLNTVFHHDLSAIQKHIDNISKYMHCFFSLYFLHNYWVNHNILDQAKLITWLQLPVQ